MVVPGLQTLGGPVPPGPMAVASTNACLGPAMEPTLVLIAYVVFSGRELTVTFSICHRPVRLSSVSL